MKTKLCICSQPNYLIFRTAIAREQKQFIKIAFAVHLSAVISAERYRSDSGALKRAVSSTSVLPCTDVDSKFCISKTCKLEPPPSMAELIVVYFYILCNIKKGSGFLRAEPLSSNFKDRRGYRGGKKLLSDKSVFPPLKTAPVNDEAKKHNENLPGMGGVFNVVNLHVYHYAGNNPIKYTDPDGRDIETVKETIKISIDLGKQLAPLFEKPNPNNLMPEAMAINKVNDIKGLLTNMADLAKKDFATFVATLTLEGFCAGIALDSGLVDSIIDLKETGIDIMGMNLSGSMNLSSSVNLKYSAQFQPNLGSSFNLGINLNGNLNKKIGDKHSLSFGISAGFTIPSKLMPTMKFSFLYKVQL